MHIVFLAAEYSPLIKVGGLGDVVEGLSKYLSYENDVEVIIPKYLNISNNRDYNQDYNLDYKKTSHADFSIFSKKEKNKKISLIEDGEYFKRKNVYGYKDDEKRFLSFSKKALKYLLSQNKEIDILHLHDWHTSIAALLYKDIFSNEGLKIKKIVLSIHNVKYQGACDIKFFKSMGLNDKKYRKNIFSRKINILALGIKYSDAIVPVSPTYAKEILTKKMGYNLQKILKKNKYKIKGILNGIDNKIWNPQKDALIFYNFSKKDPIEKIIEKKEKNKNNLREKLNLEKKDVPIISFIGRLVPQKGPKLIMHAIKKASSLNFQFVLLGSSNIKKIQKKFFRLKKKLKKRKDISLNFLFDEKLAHEIYASSDFIIIPSVFEPCGLVQMIAFAYGIIPIARKTGGLSDTVFENKNGFLFQKFNKKHFEKAIIKALNAKNKKEILKNCLSEDHSFEKCAKKYFSLYQKLINKNL